MEDYKFLREAEISEFGMEERLHILDEFLPLLKRAHRKRYKGEQQKLRTELQSLQSEMTAAREREYGRKSVETR